MPSLLKPSSLSSQLRREEEEGAEKQLSTVLGKYRAVNTTTTYRWYRLVGVVTLILFVTYQMVIDSKISTRKLSLLPKGSISLKTRYRNETKPKNHEDEDDDSHNVASLLWDGIKGEFVETIGSDGNITTYRFKPSSSPSNSSSLSSSSSSVSLPDYIGALRRYAKRGLLHETTTTTIANNDTNSDIEIKDEEDDDARLLEKLRGKRIIFMGDSTDDHLWATICSCKTKEQQLPEYVGTPIEDSTRRECLGDKFFMRSCVFPSLSLSIQYLAIEYGIHPYGLIPYDREGPNGSV